ncbi:MAG: molybdate ABC transporter substrate-binding protein [Pseudooceanicola sp.]|nr:molybdate ABC transporter substrate-binding protein [Pseudooceanicola sp.]MDF1857077.1 molybdate ABC transporter substrate-binding protein [Pseudooceanicola sp.]
MLRLILILTFAAAPLRAEQVTLFAAASLKTALDELAGEFARDSPHQLRLVYAGSSILARQIEQGAPADAFISANPGWMDVLAAQGRLVPGTRRDLLGNRLVLIGHQPGAPVDLVPGVDLAGVIGDDRLTTALVDGVPAGIYARAALEHLGAWEVLAPRLVQMDNVRAALALVALGAADFGIVYATDAAAEPRVHVLATFPEASHPPIRYPLAALRDSAGTRALLTYLEGRAARAIFTRGGFQLLGE